MTGYGRGTCEAGSRRIVVESRSVNHRFLEVKVRLPWPDPTIEMNCTQFVRSRLVRGAVLISVREEGASPSDNVRLNLSLAQQYHRALNDLRAALDIAEPISLGLVAAQPGVLTIGEALPDPERLWALMMPGLSDALNELIAARTREGQALRADMQARLEVLERLAQQIGELARDAPEGLRKRLNERLERSLRTLDATSGTAIDPQRLAQEVAILTDKADVTEELTRMGEHLRECRRLCDLDEANGRRLDFLTQELNREANTIGAKLQSSEVAIRIIEAKAEIERVREQIQNVE